MSLMISHHRFVERILMNGKVAPLLNVIGISRKLQFRESVQKFYRATFVQVCVIVILHFILRPEASPIMMLLHYFISSLVVGLPSLSTARRASIIMLSVMATTLLKHIRYHSWPERIASLLLVAYCVARIWYSYRSSSKSKGPDRDPKHDCCSDNDVDVDSKESTPSSGISLDNIFLARLVIQLAILVHFLSVCALWYLLRPYLTFLLELFM